VLWAAYTEKKLNEIGTWLRSFHSLSYLPPLKVEDAFIELISVAPADEYSYFTDYVLETYIADNACFPSSIWAGEPSYCPHTNNGPESFHSHCNAMFYSAHPNIHVVMRNLLEIQIETDMKINSIARFEWNQRCSYTADKIAYIHDEYTKYRLGAITRLKYLQRVGYRSQPNKIIK